MWLGHKLSLSHLHIWGCPAYILNSNASKLEPRSELCYSIGYPKGTRGGIFYHPKEQKVFISTHARYLENDDMIQNIPDSGIVLDEISNKSLETLVDIMNEQ